MGIEVFAGIAGTTVIAATFGYIAGRRYGSPTRRRHLEALDASRKALGTLEAERDDARADARFWRVLAKTLSRAQRTPAELNAAQAVKCADWLVRHGHTSELPPNA